MPLASSNRVVRENLRAPSATCRESPHKEPPHRPAGAFRSFDFSVYLAFSGRASKICFRHRSKTRIIRSWNRVAQHSAVAGVEIGPAGIVAPYNRVAISLEHFPSGFIPISPELYIEALLPDAKVHNRNIGQPFRQHRVNVKLVIWCIRLEAEKRLQKAESRTGRPSLWHVGPEILNRKVGGATLESGVKLRHLMLHEIAS